jgi:hypothetical protein
MKYRFSRRYRAALRRHLKPGQPASLELQEEIAQRTGTELEGL